MKKRLLSVLLVLTMLIGVISMGTLSVSADVDEGGSSQQMPAPQNVKVSFIGFKEATSGKAVVVEIAWDEIAEADGGNKFIEMWPSLKQDANLNLPMSFEAWMGQATLIPVAEVVEGGYGYFTENGRSKLRSVVHILQPGETKVGDDGMVVNGVEENDVIDIDLYTAGYDPATQTDMESEHKHVEIVYTEENVRNKKTFTEAVPSECAHQNIESTAEVLNVKGNVTIDGKTTGVALIKDTEECTDCHHKKTTKIYRLRFKRRGQMIKYLSGRYARLKNGKKVHFKGGFEKVEKVYWNKKYIKISKAYNKRKGSVILDFTDEFLSTVEDGEHELMVCNGDEFTAMTVTVQDHEMVELGAFDIESSDEISADQYDALMQECEEDGIEVVDCDLDAFYAGGFMTNADDAEVTMNLSEDTLIRTGKALELPAVTLTSDMGVEYAEDEDYTLTWYQVVDGDLVEIAKEGIQEVGNYQVVAVPTRSGVLFGEASAAFSVVYPLRGDADGDGEVSISDVTVIQRRLAALKIPCEWLGFIADADGDGAVTIVDATVIQRYEAGLQTIDCVGQPITSVPGNQISGSEIIESLLVGSWARADDLFTVITFRENGTGTYDEDGFYLDFTYTDNGDSVAISDWGSFTYSVNGAVLILNGVTYNAE